jgi:ribulose-phosphate 3-epimerase
MNRLISPGILADSLGDLKAKVELAKGFSKRVSIDVIDGVFADNLTPMPEDLREVDFSGLKVDVQLVTVEPVDFLGELHLQKVDRVFGHVERMGKPALFAAVCKELGITLGWGFDLYTPLEGIDGKDLILAEAVLLMAVKAGFSGQEFNTRVIEKIKALRKMGFLGDVVVDGGMKDKTIPGCVAAGANQFSVTSDIWEADDPTLRYEELAAILQ